jgi:hypothetical protein
MGATASSLGSPAQGASLVLERRAQLQYHALSPTPDQQQFINSTLQPTEQSETAQQGAADYHEQLSRGHITHAPYAGPVTGPIAKRPFWVLLVHMIRLCNFSPLKKI